MNTKHFIASTLAVTGIAVAAGTFAFGGSQFGQGNTGERPDNQGPRTEIREAVQNSDYARFQELIVGTHLEDVIDTEAKFQMFVEIHEALQDGDKETAKSLAEELNLQRPQKGRKQGMQQGKQQGKRHGNNEMYVAIQDQDYEAFKSAIEGKKLEELIDTEAKFQTFVQMHEAMKNGDKETAEQLREELGLPSEEEKQEHRTAVHEALQNGDWVTFQEYAGDGPMGEFIDTEAKFQKFVQMHQAAQNGDYETAKQLREELELPEHKKQNNNGFRGMRMQRQGQMELSE